MTCSKTGWLFLGSVFVLALAGVTPALYAQGAAKAPLKVQPASDLTDYAAFMVQAITSVPPRANAAKVQSIGKGTLTANTANSADDTDFLWVDEIDIDSDGNAEEASLLWDDEDKVLYLYDDGTFTCVNGGTGNGGMLMVIYGKGNTWKKSAGSGWWAVELDKSECAVDTAGIYGCKFNASGNATACGLAAVDDKNDDIVIADRSDSGTQVPEKAQDDAIALAAPEGQVDSAAVEERMLALNETALSHVRKGEYAAAVRAYEEAIRMRSESVDLARSRPRRWVQNNLAWLLATAPDSTVRDGPRALVLAEELVAWKRDDPAYLDTFAAAYAEMGRFDDAVRIQRQALAGLRRGPLRDEYRSHLKSYEDGRPWRQP